LSIKTCDTKSEPDKNTNQS